MFHTQRRVSSRIVLALCIALCVLPGCGSGSSSAVTTSTVARSRAQTFQGQNIALATYTLDGPIDQTKPFAVLVGGIPLAQGTDYFIDTTFPNEIHINNPVPATSSVVVQYYTFPTVTDQFNITGNSQTAFTLSHPADVTEPISVLLATVGSTTATGTPVSSQNYTVTAGPPTVIRLNTAPLPSSTLTITYVPKAQ